MRLFIAIDFNELKETLLKVQNSIDGSLAKLKEVSTFHLTLKFLGELSDDKAKLIKEKLKEIIFTPFSVTLENIGVFPSENYIRVIWVGVKPKEEVTKLQENIEKALKEFNFKKDSKFHPHITLARVKYVDDKEKFIKNIKNIKVEEKTIEVKDFRLIKSTLTPKGHIYEDLQSFQAVLK